MAGLLLEQPGEHVPRQPSWTCAACGDEWPCEYARADLVAESSAGRTPVLVYLAICLADAVGDLSPGGLSPGLYDRFVGWACGDLNRAQILKAEGINSR